MYQSWTTAQEQLLREYGSLGAKRCAELLAEQYGVKRSVQAIQMHASRIGVSLYEYHTCIHCGRKAKKLRHTGLCEVCHLASLTEQQITRVRELQHELDIEEVRTNVEVVKQWRQYRAWARKAQRLSLKKRDRRRQPFSK
jgi:uncharacterized Fe-S cluster-containing radical SAM superfamily enzyme